MKRLILLFLMCLIAFNLIAAERVDFIVAKVGREIILFSDLVRQINQMRSARMWDETMTELLVLNSMIENKLIVQKARELNIRVDERRIQSAANEQIEQIRASFRTEEEFFRELRNAGMLLSDLRSYYTDMLTEQFLRDRLIQTEIRGRINITEADIVRFYNEERYNFPMRDESFEIAMILRIPAPSEQTDIEARERITAIKNRIQGGADFEVLAQQFSDCPSGQSGGDLGFFARGTMVEEFERASFNLEVNQVSDIVRTQFGYHLIKLTDRRGSEVRASHILVMLSESMEDVEQERLFMNELLVRLRHGEDFAALATVYSHEESSKNNNGIIGNLTIEEIPHFFAPALNNLEVGHISDVLEHENMFYIFTVNRIIPPHTPEFSYIREQLRELLTIRRQVELYEQWVEDLQSEIFVQIYEERLRAN